MTERSCCSSCSTGPGAWPRWQFSAMRALYLGPDGSGGDLLECSVDMTTARLEESTTTRAYDLATVRCAAVGSDTAVSVLGSVIRFGRCGPSGERLASRPMMSSRIRCGTGRD